MNTYTAVIRDRNQVTLPQGISALLPWIKSTSPIKITITNPHTITIEPHVATATSTWDELYAQMKTVRSFKGKNDTSLSDFIHWDRQFGHD